MTANAEGAPSRSLAARCLSGLRRTLLAGVVAASGLAVSACSSSPGTMSLPLIYGPTNDIDGSAFAAVPPVAAGTSIWIDPIADLRTDPARIGLSEEDDPVSIYHSTGQVPAEFVRNVLARDLVPMGIPITADPNTASHRLSMQLLKFWVHETNTYKGEVIVRVALVDRAGQALWQGDIMGTNDRWGRTLKEENFMETLSDSTLDLAVNVATHPYVRAALATGQVQPPGAPAPAP